MSAGGDDQLVFPVLALILGLVLDATNERIRFLNIPDTILVFFFASLASFTLHAFLPIDMMEHVDMRFTWNRLEPETIVRILLPPLIFESAFKINSYLFYRKLVLLTLNTAFVYVATLLIYAAFVLPVLRICDNWTIYTVLLLSSILAATDPVAVEAILEEAGAPQRLRILIEGGSLLNDGFAIFAYNIFSSCVKAELRLSEAERPETIIMMCFSCILLSPIIGFLSAHFVIRVICHLVKDDKRIQAFLVITVYIVWTIGEATNGSPAVTIVFYGVTLNGMRESLEPSTVKMALHIWASLGYWANCVIFTFGGYSIGVLLFTSPLKEEIPYLILSGALLYPMTLLARTLSLYIFKRFWDISSSRNPVYTSDYVILAYGGLQGALALLLAHDFTKISEGNNEYLKEVTEKIEIYCSSSVFMCLIVQGMTFAVLTQREGTNRRAKCIKDSEKNLEYHLNRQLRAEIQKLRKRSEMYLAEANWTVVDELIEAAVFKRFTAEVRSRVQTSEECSAQSASTIVEKNESEQSRDVCVGYYSIILSRVFGVWARGALSGPSAHLIIELLEQGIDEGKLDQDDFDMHLKTAKLNVVQRLLLTVFTFLKKWIDKDTWLNRFCKIGEPFLLEDYPVGASVFIPRRSHEWWHLFSTLLTLSYSIALAVTTFNDVESWISYGVLICGCFLAMVFTIEQIVLLHVLRKIERPLEIDEPQTRCFSWMSRYTAEKCYWCIATVLVVVMFFSLVAALESFFGPSCLSEAGRWSVTNKLLFLSCGCVRLLLLVVSMLLTCLKLLPMVPLFIFTVQESLLAEKLLRLRVQLSALYYLQYLLTQPTVTFTLFSENDYQIAIREQQNLVKIVDAMIRRTMKQNEELLDIVPVVKTRQAIRMISYALQNAITELTGLGLVHELSVAKWMHTLDRLREQCERLVIAPAAGLYATLEKVYWIAKLDQAKKRTVIEKLADYITKCQEISIESNVLVETEERVMYFLKKGICRVTLTLGTSHGSTHCHHYYLHQGAFIGGCSLLTKCPKPEELKKKPQIQFHTTTDCVLVLVDEGLVEWLRNIDVTVRKAVSRYEQSVRLIYELKEHRQLFSLMTVDAIEKFLQKFEILISEETNVTVFSGKKLIIGWRTIICSVKPPNAIDDHLHIVGPADVVLKPAADDEGIVVLIDSTKSDEPKSTAEPASVISLRLDESEMKKKKDSSLKGQTKQKEGVQTKQKEGLRTVTPHPPVAAPTVLTHPKTLEKKEPQAQTQYQTARTQTETLGTAALPIQKEKSAVAPQFKKEGHETRTPQTEAKDQLKKEGQETLAARTEAQETRTAAPQIKAKAPKKGVPQADLEGAAPLSKAAAITQADTTITTRTQATVVAATQTERVVTHRAPAESRRKRKSLRPEGSKERDKRKSSSPNPPPSYDEELTQVDERTEIAPLSPSVRKKTKKEAKLRQKPGRDEPVLREEVTPDDTATSEMATEEPRRSNKTKQQQATEKTTKQNKTSRQTTAHHKSSSAKKVTVK